MHLSQLSLPYKRWLLTPVSSAHLLFYRILHKSVVRLTAHLPRIYPQENGEKIIFLFKLQLLSSGDVPDTTLFSFYLHTCVFPYTIACTCTTVLSVTDMVELTRNRSLRKDHHGRHHNVSFSLHV